MVSYCFLELFKKICFVCLACRELIGPLCSALNISVPGVPSQSHHRFSRGRALRYNNRDRPAQTPYCEVLFVTCKLLWLQSFALTSMSSSVLPLLYDIIGGFLKMVLSNG